jgi:hypothetical protein
MSRHSILQPYAEHTEKERPIEILLDQCLRSHALRIRGQRLRVGSVTRRDRLSAGPAPGLSCAGPGTDVHVWAVRQNLIELGRSHVPACNLAGEALPAPDIHRPLRGV